MNKTNSLIKKRSWIETFLGSRIKLGGYVVSKKMEIVISIATTGLFHLTRQFGVMIFPTVIVRFCAIFAYVPAMFLPWKYTLVIPALVAFTSSEPIGSVLALGAGIQVAYFGSRLLSKKYKIISLIFATFTANFVGTFVRAKMLGLFPFETAFMPMLVKASALAVVMLIFAPIILKILESKGVINFKKN